MNSVIVVESSDEDELHPKIRQNKKVKRKQNKECEMLSTTTKLNNNNINKSLTKTIIKPECDSIMKSKQFLKTTMNTSFNSHVSNSALTTKKPTQVKIFTTVKTIPIPKTITSCNIASSELSKMTADSFRIQTNVKKNVPLTKSSVISKTTISTAKATQPKKSTIVSTPLKCPPQATTKLVTTASAQLVSLKTQSNSFTSNRLPPLQPSPQMQNQMRKRKLNSPAMTTTAKALEKSEANISHPNITKQITRDPAIGVTTNNNSIKGTLGVKSIQQSPLPVVLTNCSTFNSIDADVMPPLQLMATPPHQSSAFSNNEKGITIKKTNDNINNKNKIGTNMLPKNNSNEILPKKIQCTPNKPTSLIKDKNKNGIIHIQDAIEDKDSKAKENVGVKVERQSNCESEIIFLKNKPILVSVDLSAIDLTRSPERSSPSNDKLGNKSIVTRNKESEEASTSELKEANTQNLSIDDICNTDSSNNNKPHQTPEYIELLKVLRKADNSPDMETLIEKKLNKYYTAVSYSSFIKSRGFRKNIRSVTDMINRDPDLVYFHLKSVLEELKSRYHCKPTQCDNDDDNESIDNDNMENATIEIEESPEIVSKSDESSQMDNNSTTSSLSRSREKNKQINIQIQKLNAALHVLTKNIEKLEQAEVDFDDEDSSYMQVERLKKRACQIYNKICDLTGESKNAHRLIKKPIQFNGTQFPQFNKTLRAYINRTKEFPDYYDVLHMVEHCNRKYEFGLANYQIKRLAEDAFIQVGKLLQARRKTDLYETVSHFTANASDPAKNDPLLLAKLNENKQVQKRIGDVIAKYAREQDRVLEEQRAQRRKSEDSNSNVFLSRNRKKLKPSINYSSCEDNDEDYNENIDTDDEPMKNVEPVTNGMSAMTKIDNDSRIKESPVFNKESKDVADQSRDCELSKGNSNFSKISMVKNNAPMQELKISSVYSLASSKEATPISTRKTPRTISVPSATISATNLNMTQNKEPILEKSTRPLMEIWISDDEDELAKKRTTLEKTV